MDSKRNSLVDVTRMVCAFFVIAIHTNLGIENELTWILFQTIARIAVPYFLVVTGWFFYRNILINQRVIFNEFAKSILDCIDAICGGFCY